MATTLRQRRQGAQVDSTEAPVEILKSAPPPWHAILLIVILLVFFVSMLPSLETLDEIARVETFQNSLFGLSISQVGLIRALVASIIWVTTIVVFFSNGWDVSPPYIKGSKLKMTTFRLRGVKTLYPFTIWYVF